MKLSSLLGKAPVFSGRQSAPRVFPVAPPPPTPRRPSRTYRWATNLNDRRARAVIEAPTKSEARAELKRLLGIPGKGRLPIGVKLRRVRDAA